MHEANNQDEKQYIAKSHVESISAKENRFNWRIFLELNNLILIFHDKRLVCSAIFFALLGPDLAQHAFSSRHDSLNDTMIEMKSSERAKKDKKFASIKSSLCSVNSDILFACYGV